MRCSSIRKQARAKLAHEAQRTVVRSTWLGAVSLFLSGGGALQLSCMPWKYVEDCGTPRHAACQEASAPCDGLSAEFNWSAAVGAGLSLSFAPPACAWLPAVFRGPQYWPRRATMSSTWRCGPDVIVNKGPWPSVAAWVERTANVRAVIKPQAVECMQIIGCGERVGRLDQSQTCHNLIGATKVARRAQCHQIDVASLR